MLLSGQNTRNISRLNPFTKDSLNALAIILGGLIGSAFWRFRRLHYWAARPIWWIFTERIKSRLLGKTAKYSKPVLLSLCFCVMGAVLQSRWLWFSKNEKSARGGS